MRRAMFTTAAMLMLAATAAAQIHIVDRAKLDSIANPPTAAGAERLSFCRTAIDAGTLREDDEPQRYEYRFRNLGDEPAVITRLTTTCGCTSAEAVPAVVGAGDEGSIIVTYRPRGHVGTFQRRVFVYTGLSERLPTATLTLGVTVTAGEDADGEYPFRAGVLRMKRNALRFRTGDPAAETIEVFNTGDEPVTVDCNRKVLPPCIGFECTPRTIEPRSSADLTVRFDAAKMPEGRRSLAVPLMLTGTGAEGVQSTIYITINDND